MHIGLIGGGNISSTHARAARACGLTIAAVFGTNEQKVKVLASEFGATPYADFASFLLHRPMELVAIGSPSGLHAEQGIAAAQHGLHVLTEKPIDIATSRADALIAAVDRAAVKLGVFFQDRCKPELVRLKQLIAANRLGRLLHVDAQVKWYRPPEYYADSRWRGTLALDGGGALMNQAIHTVDLLLWLAGDVRRVQSLTRTALHQIESEDTAMALLEFESGAVGTMLATTAAFPGYPRRLEITGTNGTVIVEGDLIAGIDLRDGAAKEETARPSPATQSVQSASSPVVSDVSAHAAVLQNFVNAITTGAPVVCDGREGRRSLALVEAIYRAAAEPLRCT